MNNLLKKDITKHLLVLSALIFAISIAVIAFTQYQIFQMKLGCIPKQITGGYIARKLGGATYETVNADCMWIAVFFGNLPPNEK